MSIPLRYGTTTVFSTIVKLILPQNSYFSKLFFQKVGRRFFFQSRKPSIYKGFVIFCFFTNRRPTFSSIFSPLSLHILIFSLHFLLQLNNYNSQIALYKLIILCISSKNPRPTFFSKSPFILIILIWFILFSICHIFMVGFYFSFQQLSVYT